MLNEERRPCTRPPTPGETTLCSSRAFGLQLGEKRAGPSAGPLPETPKPQSSNPLSPSQGAGILNLREVPKSPRLTLCMKMGTVAPWKGARAPSLHSPPRTGPLVPSPGFQPHAWLLGHIRLFATPWTTGGQAPPSMGCSRQEHWSGLPCPPPGVFPTQGSNLDLPHCRRIL